MTSGVAWADADPEAVESHLRSVLSDPGFQTELPAGTPPSFGGSRDGTGHGGSGDRTGHGGSGDGTGRRGSTERPIREGGGDAQPAPSRGPVVSLPRGGAMIAKAFAYVLATALVVVLLFALVSTLARHRRLQTRLEDDAVDPESLRDVAPEGGATELEELIRAGRFAEAVHLLLQRALGRIERRTGGRLAKSLTSREILRRSALGGSERESLDTLVEAVERSLFGGLTVDREEYDRCATAFASLFGKGATG